MQEFNWGYDPVNYNVPERDLMRQMPDMVEVRILGK